MQKACHGVHTCNPIRKLRQGDVQFKARPRYTEKLQNLKNSSSSNIINKASKAYDSSDSAHWKGKNKCTKLAEMAGRIALYFFFKVSNQDCIHSTYGNLRRIWMPET